MIEQGLNDWEAYFHQTSEQLRQQLQTLSIESEALEVRQKTIYQDQSKTENALNEQEKIEQHYQQLTIRFQFTADLAQLEKRRQSVQEQRDELMRSIKNAEHRQSVESVKREITKLVREVSDLRRQLANIDDNLYLKLQKLLPAESFELLTRLLARSVLSLPVDEGNIIELNDTEAFQSFAAKLESRLSANRLELPGLSLELLTLEPNLIVKTVQELETEINDGERQLAELKNLLTTIEGLNEQRQQQIKLEKEIAELDADIKDYKELLALQDSTPARLQAMSNLQQQLATLKQEEEGLRIKKKDLEQAQTNRKNKQEELQNQHRRINNARHQRLDQQVPFTFLEQLPYLPCMEPAELDMAALADRIEDYNRNCQNLRRIDDNLSRQLNDLHHDGVSKFQTQDSPELELNALFN